MKTPAKATDANGLSIPSAVIKNGSTTFELHVYRAGQSCRIAQGATMEFGASIGSKSAGLVYVTKGLHGINAQDSHVDEPSVWNWIAEWMQKGMDAERRLAEEQQLAKSADESAQADRESWQEISNMLDKAMPDFKGTADPVAWTRLALQKIIDRNTALEAAATHTRLSIDKDNNWGPMEWEAWNTKAKELLAAIQ